MIPRYQTPEMAAVWTDTARMQRWLDVELAAVDALEATGVAPAGVAAACRTAAPVVDDAFVAAVLEREAVTDHDVAAFVDVAQDRIGHPHGDWVHYGLTSSDVVDTALCWAMRDAVELLLAEADVLLHVLVDLARVHRHTVMIGRTHGIHAEPTTFGAKLALWALQVDRDRVRLRAARETVAVMKLSGAVGTYSNLPPEVEARVGEALGLQAVPATQVIARDRHAELLWACAAVASTCELIAVELRHLQRTEVGEVREGFRPGQKGSSAMPHKRNPISAETISGLSRVVKSNALAGLHDVALWHERDISHTTVERVELPDSTILAHYLLRRTAGLLRRLEVFPERMAENMAAGRGVVFSQSVLLELVRNGMERDAAYRVVQRAAMTSWDDGRDFVDVISSDPDVPDAVRTRLPEIVDLRRVLQHAGRAVDALDVIVPHPHS
ncbi:MAG: adenylosuccinate lyase [Ilumatobacteraceae bacterium]|nr:adenylosuccinate lyase [Ilumatobacteraceae bacterium]